MEVHRRVRRRRGAIPATASSRRTPRSPRRSRTRESPSSVRPRAPSTRWAPRPSRGSDAGRRRPDRARHHRPGRHGGGRVQDHHEDIGFPVAVKAAGGGGGKGFRVALEDSELEAAFEGASREGEKFFSDGRSTSSAICPTRATSRYRSSPITTAAHPSRRARLLGAAPPPEGHRGVSGPRRRRRAARPHRRRSASTPLTRSTTSAPAPSRACCRTASTSSWR